MLIVEDGTGVANAESLASVAFCDTYHADRGNAAWGAFTLQVKEQQLRKATDYAVAVYNNAWSGLPVASGQSLPFPRIVDSLNVGVPLSIKQAIAELALIAKTTPLMPNVTRGKKRVKIGPIDIEYDGSAPTSVKFISASLRFGPWLATPVSAAMVKLTRS